MAEIFSYRALLADSPILDIGGECGSIAHYALIVALVGSAFLIFLYLWKKGKLDMDEEPKHRMMQDEREMNKQNSQNHKENLHD